MKGKVLFLVNHDIVIYNFRKEIVERLLQEGYEVIISSPYGERIDELISMGAKFVEVKMDRHGVNIISEIRLLIYYKRLYEDVKPDIVFGFTIKPNIYGALAAKKNKIPFVANITGLGTAVENKGILQKIIIALYKISFSKVQTVFFQNQENKDFFKTNKIAESKHKNLPGSGVNLDHFKPINYPSDETIEFVFISRIMKEKGIDIYLEAAKVLRKKYPYTRFHVCGFCEEDYEETLKELHQQEIIHYHGMVKDIRNVLRKTHCTVHPTSYPEGISNVLLESAASARPIITTNRSGCREVVDENKNGFLIKERDFQDLISKIEFFLSIEQVERLNMGLAGRAKVEKEFNRQFVVDAYLKEIKN